MKQSHHSTGMAMILVLAFLTLLVALFVAYFATITHAVKSSANYKNSVAVQQLADTAVNIVMGQIADGTHTAKQAAPNESLVWMSQPGLIRTYDTDGKPYRFYKLYSSAEMVEQRFENGYWSPEENVEREVPGDWFEQRGLFADLNEPVLVPVDFDAESGNPKDAIRVGEKLFYANYPILDPTAQTPNKIASREGVEGFAIDAKRVSGAPPNPPRTDYNPTEVTDSRRSPNPAPMPVRWLYILRDGRLTVPERSTRGASGREEIRWVPDSPDAPTRDNPIVGRIAFWADDETCKLNVNTASEGTFWDRPTGAGVGIGPFSEQTLASGIPRHNEWQRTPGHPAMTCLSPVFGMLPDFRVPLTSNYNNADYAKFAAYYDFVPRIGKGGTEAGTRSKSREGGSKGAITPDQDRLFASPDEVLFTPRLTAALRERSNPQITRDFLEKAKFFLTNSNRAPETNIFNRPRISLWPVQQEKDPNRGHPGCPDRPRTSQDDLFAACATLNEQPYFFQRYSVYLKGNIHNRASHPDDPFAQQGSLRPPSSQRTDLDWKIARNHQLYRYLQNLTERSLPGVPGRVKFADKLGADRDQLLTSMVDLLRTANDLKPPMLEGSYDYSPPHEDGSAGEGRRALRHLGIGQVVPLAPPAGTPGAGTKGTGRFPTISEAAFVFFRTFDNRLGAMMTFQPFAPTAGPPTWVPLVRICVRGLDQFSIDGRSLDMPGVATNLYAPAFMCPHTTQAFNCFAAMHTFQAPGGGAPDNKKAGTQSEEKNYPFYSRNLLPPPAGNGFKFRGGRITVEIHAGYYGKPGSALAAPPAESLVQTLEFDFPETMLPVPPPSGLSLDERINQGIVVGTEVVRSVQVNPTGPTGGDLRLLSAPPFVPANYFHPHPDYFTTKLAAHSMRSYGRYLNGARDDVQLLAGISSPFGVAANGLRGARLPGTARSGDWDTGVGTHPQGAQYPRPDEGNDQTQDGGYYIQAYMPETGTTWSPMRQLPSPVVFGSLPVGVNPLAPKPWRTLLFCANPASGKNHPGWQQPRDHALLDFFQMPVVEPYAISEPLATSGKVNLNCQIVPFTYIQRDTALRGAFRATKMTAIVDRPGYINTGQECYSWPTTTLRLDIDADETLKGFQRRFADKGGCFKTASELCEMFLVPTGAKLNHMADGDPEKWWWKNYASTGDNLRESPYGHLYSRVTARSNTFTVHYRVQVLGHNAAEHPDAWLPGSDPILSEARGSTLIERYVDPNDPRLPDFATDPKATLDECYKFRIQRVERFGR